MSEQVVPDDIIDVDAVVSAEYEQSKDDVPPFVYESILHEEISMEEALLQRLKETITKRLEWALKLQSLALNGESNGIKVEETEHIIPQTPFSDAAKGAYEAISSTSILTSTPEYSRPANYVPHPDSIAHQLGLVRQHVPPTPQLPTPISNGFALPPRTRHTTRVPPPQTNQYLYILDTLSTPSLLYKLTCPHPSCRRSDFPRLQGLLNHCRIKHGQEYGSHDECIQACAVLVETEEEREKVVREGLEITGMSASLKRLFEIAVGKGVAVVTGTALAEQMKNTTEDGTEAMEVDGSAPFVDSANSASTLLSQTLGIHADTPALAPFLRTAQRKRCINVHDENAVVDIDAEEEITSADIPSSTRRPWRKVHQQRSRAESESDVDDIIALSYELDGSLLVEGADDGRETTHDELRGGTTGKMVETSAGSTRSRFHVTARLGISDWSMRIADDPHRGLTHRWMIVVQAPAYSIHASTFIASLTLLSVTPATFLNVPNPTANVSSPQTTTSPPYIFAGTTNVPFGAVLAVELVGSGPKKGRTVRVEQWVDIEAGKTDRPQHGDEQLLDVELDRNVSLLPRRGDDALFATTDSASSTNHARNDDRWYAEFYAAAVLGGKKPLPGKGVAGEGAGKGKDGGADDGTKGDGQGAGAKGRRKGAKEPEPAHVAQLRALLPRFPMTLRDAVVKSRPTAQLQVPYLLPMSPTHFNAMVLGRKKAIEWGRARALYDAYSAIQSATNSSSAGVHNVQSTPNTAPPASALPESTSTQTIASDNTAPDAVKSEPTDSAIPPEQQPQTKTPLLSVCDIYRWLETEGHFIRTPKSKLQAAESGKAKDGEKAGKVKIKVKLKGKSVDPTQGETTMGGMVMGGGLSGVETNVTGDNKSKSKSRPEVEYCPLCGLNLRVAGAGARTTTTARGSGKADHSSAGSSKISQESVATDTPASPLATHLCPMRSTLSSNSKLTANDATIATLKPPLLDVAAILQRCASERMREKTREDAVAAMTVSTSNLYSIQAGHETYTRRASHFASNDSLNPDQSLAHVRMSDGAEPQARQPGRTGEMQSSKDLDIGGSGMGRGVSNRYDKALEKNATNRERGLFLNGDVGALVACTDPTLVRAIRRIVDNMSRSYSRVQSRLQSLSDGGGPDDDEAVTSSNRAISKVHALRLGEVESVDDIAPYALLGQLARVYLRRLVTDGMNVLNTSSRYTSVNGYSLLQAFTATSAQFQGQQAGARITGSTRGSSQATPSRLLTPAHIYRGLEERARRTEGLDGVLLSVARLGEWVDELDSGRTQ